MGIKGNINAFLQKNAPSAFTTEIISCNNFPRIAVDTPIFLNKYRAIYGVQWRKHFENFLMYFKNGNIELWCVFDGLSLFEKHHEIEQRKKNRERITEMVSAAEISIDNYLVSGEIDSVLIDINKRFLPSFLTPSFIHIRMAQEFVKRAKRHIYKLAPDDFNWAVKKIFDMDFVVLTAMNEAEKVCAKLCQKNICVATMSDDTDLLAFCCPKILTKFNLASKTSQVVTIERIFHELNFSPEQFVDFCIMCGTDFNKNCANIGTLRAFNYIREFGSIENFALQTGIDISILNFERVREIFSSDK